MRRLLSSTCLAVGLSVLAAGVAFAQAPAQQGGTPPAGPTIGDVLRQYGAQVPGQQSTVNCRPPKPPEKMPDERTASEAEMRAIHDTVKAYLAEGDGFRACLDKAFLEAQSRMTVQEYLTLVGLQDQMLTAMERVANAFNEQLRLHRAKGR